MFSEPIVLELRNEIRRVNEPAKCEMGKKTWKERDETQTTAAFVSVNMLQVAN